MAPSISCPTTHKASYKSLHDWLVRLALDLAVMWSRKWLQLMVLAVFNFDRTFARRLVAPCRHHHPVYVTMMYHALLFILRTCYAQTSLKRT